MQNALTKSKPRILIISSLGPLPYLGGIENVIDTLLTSTLKSTYTFSIFDTYRRPDPGRTIFSKFFFALRLPVMCGLSIVKYKPEIVHIHFCSNVDFWKHSICLFTVKLFRKKTIFHLHGGSFDSIYEHYPKLTQKIVGIILSSPDILVALSSYWKKYLSNITKNVPIRIVQNPIDCDRLSSYVPENKETVPLSVLLLGSLGKRKGHYDVIKAAPIVLSKYPNTQFYFAGIDEEFNATEALKKVAEENGSINNIHFLGPVTGVKKLKLLGKAGIVILPSYGENMPISVLEGMSAYKPIIATTVGAVPEVIIENESGLLITPGDWQSLGANINYIFENPELAVALGEEAGRRVRQNWDISKISSIFDEMYQSLLTDN